MYQTPPPPRVLVADDQSDILQALRRLLVDAGIEPELVNSVDGIRDRVGKTPFDLLLMDLNYTRDTIGARRAGADHRSARARPPSAHRRDDRLGQHRYGGRCHAPRRADARLQREQDDARLIQRTLLPSSLPALTGIRIAAMWNRRADRHRQVRELLLPGGRSRQGQAHVRQRRTQPASARAGRRARRGRGAGPATGPIQRLLSGGMVLGVMPDATYDQHEVAVSAGDRLILYTDGIVDAENPAGADYGEGRLGSAAAVHSALGPQEAARGAVRGRIGLRGRAVRR